MAPSPFELAFADFAGSVYFDTFHLSDAAFEATYSIATVPLLAGTVCSRILYPWTGSLSM